MNRQAIEALKREVPTYSWHEGNSISVASAESWNAAIDAVLAQIDGTDINGELLAALKLIERSEFCGKPMKAVTMKCIARAAIANAENAAKDKA